MLATIPLEFELYYNKLYLNINLKKTEWHNL